jgi:molecular chaperone DnaK (HSP70)
VAALLGVESMYLPLPIGEPILVIDAGGGTLDAAVCVAERDPELGTLRYTIPFASSIGVAGESLFEEFVKTLARADAFEPKLPRQWRGDARLRSALRRLFQDYSLASVETYTDELSSGEERFAVSFSPAAIEESLSNNRLFRKIQRFIGGLLEQHNTITGSEREAWGASYLVGGLGRYPLFKRTVQEVLPSCQSTPNPQEIIAMGAVSHAMKGGLQIHQRACPYHLGQQVQDLDVGKLVWGILVKQGELISSAHERTYLGESHVQFDSQGFKATFGWTRSADIDDTVLVVTEHIISFRDVSGKIQPLKAGDALQTKVRFDDKLRIELEVIHVSSGRTWSTAGLRW